MKATRNPNGADGHAEGAGSRDPAVTTNDEAICVEPALGSMLLTAGQSTARHRLIPFGWASVTLLAVAAVVLSLANAPGTIGLLGAALALVMLVIAVIDWHHFVIPDGLTATGLVLAVVHALAQEPDAMLSAVMLAAMRGTVLALIFMGVRSGYARIRGRQGLGLGDVKLAGVAGAWLDWSTLPIAVELAALVAVGAYALRRAVLGQPLSATHRVPFGLFFAPAIWLCWLIETIWLRPL